MVTCLFLLAATCGSGNIDPGGGGVPSLPNLLAPLRAIVANLRPTFQWASNLATSYDLYLSLDSNPALRTTVGIAQYAPSTDLNAGELYYWKVIGKNAVGNSPSSVISYFITPEQMPSTAAIRITDALYSSNSQVVVSIKGYNLTNVSGIELHLTFVGSELEVANLGGDYANTFQLIGPVSGALLLGSVGTNFLNISLSMVDTAVNISNNEILRIYFNTKNGRYPAKIAIANTSIIIVNNGGIFSQQEFEKTDTGIFLIGS